MSELRQLVVCSLEPWDEVWRRNQFLVEGLLRRNPRLRVLFVEPPGSGHGLRRVSDRLWAFRPRKLVPRRFADGSLRRQALRAARSIALDAPVLWVNDVTYAPLAAEAGWPMLYDVTDDWLLAPAPTGSSRGSGVSTSARSPTRPRSSSARRAWPRAAAGRGA